MAFPIPPDARAPRDFEIVRGFDHLFRDDVDIAVLTAEFDPGEWVKRDPTGKAIKLAVSDDAASPALGARLCFTRYRHGDTYRGQSDAIATGKLTLVGGKLQAKTRLYETGAVYELGTPLVAIWSAPLGRGILAPINGGDVVTATPRQLAAVVARVLELGNGLLHFESA